ncbi:MAG: NUDIX hydrolase [Deltaproteobacteria bacterium SG8_13]|nr:MAG: NUDIX hydrolase [Deltaproteobacteria bacterium SG8_13]
MNFVPALHPPPVAGRPPWWFVFQNNRLLVRRSATDEILPYLVSPVEFESILVERQYLGTYGSTGCYTAWLPAGAPQPEGLEFVGLRQLFGVVEEDLLWIAGRANQLVHWAVNHRFCGRCGQLARDKEDERARICDACRLVYYPRISPAVIVAVVRGDRLLLARSTRFTSSFHSVLAGFVETGETLEEAVRREVFEEVGIDVHNIRYFGSQPWPFPDSLMVAFTAEYAGGEITLDDDEIVTADWYHAADLPRVPGKISIARRLIDWFAETYSD